MKRTMRLIVILTLLVMLAPYFSTGLDGKWQQLYEACKSGFAALSDRQSQIVAYLQEQFFPQIRQILENFF